MKRMLLIVNPNAGRAQIKGKLADVLDVFTKAGYWTEVYITQKPGETVSVAKTRGSKLDRIVCCGGDGTLDETINGLMQIREEKRPELGYIPAGTTNDFAHSMNLPTDMLAAAKRAAEGKPFAVDVGRMNGVYFSYTVGFGAFTEVSYATDQDLKKLLGHQAYLMEGAKGLANLRSHHMKAVVNGKLYEGDYLLGMVSNSVQVAGFTGIWGEKIEMDDGLFEVNLLKQPDNLAGWGDLLSKFFVTHEESEYIIRLKTSEISFHSNDAVAWVQDGEFGGSMKDVEIEVQPHAIRFIR